MIRVDEGPDGTRVVSLDRPERANALTLELARELGDTLLTVMQSGPRGIILTGAGRTFCGGADLMAVPDDVSMGDNLRRFYGPLVALLHDAPVPVVAALNGMAAGGGLGLALACHVRVAAAGSALSATFCDVGLVPDCGASYFLVRMLGVRGAYDFCTGGPLTADEAHRLGLVHVVVPPEELISTAAEMVTSGPVTQAQRETWRLLHAATALDLASAIELEAQVQDRLGRAPGFWEAREAFFARRESKATRG